MYCHIRNTDDVDSLQIRIRDGVLEAMALASRRLEDN